MPAAPDAILDLERIVARGWRAITSAPLGGWVLRASGGFSGRANSVLPLGDPGLPLDTALDRVDSFYRSRSLAPRFHVPLGADDGLDDALAGRGWTAVHRTEVRLGDTAALLHAEPTEAPSVDVVLRPTPDAAWCSGYLGRDVEVSPSAVPVLLGADLPMFATACRGGRQLGVARGVVHDGMLGLSAVTVEQDARRSGVGRHLMAALGRWGLAHGAERVYLQVEASNTVACAVYDRLSLSVHHQYHYRLAP